MAQVVPVGLVTGGMGDPQDARWRPTDHAFYGERAGDVYDSLPKWCASDPEEAGFPTCPCPVSDYMSAHSFSVLMDCHHSHLSAATRSCTSASAAPVWRVSDVNTQKWD